MIPIPEISSLDLPPEVSGWLPVLSVTLLLAGLLGCVLTAVAHRAGRLEAWHDRDGWRRHPLAALGLLLTLAVGYLVLVVGLLLLWLLAVVLRGLLTGAVAAARLLLPRARSHARELVASHRVRVAAAQGAPVVSLTAERRRRTRTKNSNRRGRRVR